MPNRLLARQVELLEHLTSSAGIFGVDGSTATDRSRLGIHGGLLHLEARLSHEKRMQKIEWVLTRTLQLLGRSRASIVRDFVAACPPLSISWLENARQFHAFLSALWQRETPEPPYLPDVASYELAYATVRAGESDKAAAAAAPAGAFRRHPDAVLLRCAYDIRPILEGRADDSGPQRRETLIAVAMPPGSDEPLVSELSPDLFAFVEMLDQFSDPAILEKAPELEALVADLAARGLIEVHP